MPSPISPKQAEALGITTRHERMDNGASACALPMAAPTSALKWTQKAAGRTATSTGASMS